MTRRTRTRTRFVTRALRALGALGALATLAALAALVALPRDAQAQRTRIDSTFAFGKGGYVDVALNSGEIIISGWTRPEARVIAISEKGDLETSFSSNRISINVSSRRSSGSSGRTRYELFIPIGTRVMANARAGDIRVKGTNGEVEVHTMAGDVEVLDAVERIVISTFGGGIHAARLRGRIRISGSGSDIDAEELTGDIEAKTVGGSITLLHVKSSQVRMETVSGDLTYSGTVDEKGSYELSTHSGDVRMDIPASTSASLELQTYNGSISSRFPMTLQPGERSRSKSGKKMNFTINDGGARIVVGTYSGDITIERSNRSSKED